MIADDVYLKKTLAAGMLLTVLCTVIFKAALDYVYIHFESVYYGPDYTVDLHTGNFVMSYVLLVLAAGALALIFHGRNNPSRIVFILYFVFIVIPLMAFYGVRSLPTASTYVYMILVCFLLAALISQVFPKIILPNLSTGFLILSTGVIILITCYVYGFLFLTGGLQRLNFNFYTVYQVRGQLGGTTAPLMGYLIPWQSDVVNMSVLVYALYKRKHILVAAIVVAQLLLFGMTNFKSFLFAPFLVVLIYAVSGRKNLLLLFLAGAIAVVTSSYIVYLVSGEIMVPAVFIHRLFFIPGNIHLWFYDFFSQDRNPFVMLSNSILSNFSSYPYELPITSLIAVKYANQPSGANTGYLADAYAHFGYAGMVVFSVMLGFFMKVVDGFATKLPTYLVGAIIAVPAMSLVNSGMFTVMLTHGFLFAAFIVWVLSGWLNNKPEPHSGGERQPQRDAL